MSQTHDYYLLLQRTADLDHISYNTYVYCRLVQKVALCYATLI